MTFYEHAMLGANGALALGLHRRHGWRIVALSGLAAVLPDWDGLSLLFGAHAYDRVHRTVGHCLLVSTLLGAALAAAEYRLDLAGRARAWASRWLRELRSEEPYEAAGKRGTSLPVWLAVGVLATWSHLAADLVFSGHATYGDWGLRLLWPFSDRAWAYPMVPWGDVGVAVIFVAGTFALVHWPARAPQIAGLTLAAVAAYVVVRGMAG
jgi:membrane-bound metal-dependent hydrolase YbcI (DUF457 family)